MKQVQDFDIEKEAWKVKKGRSNLYTDKLITTEGDSLPRTGSPVQSDEAFSGNPMNLIKSQRINTGDEIVNSTEVLSPLSAKGNGNPSINKNPFANQTAAPLDIVNRQNLMKGIQSKRNGTNNSMILSERMNNRLNADLEFSRDSQSLIKSRQGEGNSIN